MKLGWPFRRRRAEPERGTVNPPGEAERLLRRLDFSVVRRLDGLRQGEHRNLAYGFGMDLAELREYVPGDDVRALDWNVTARMDRPFVRRFHEDREVTAWLVLDLTPSTDFGSAVVTKRELLLDCAGTLARLLTAGGDRVGALLYTGSTPLRRRAPRQRGLWAGGTLGEPDRMPAEVVRAGSGRQHVLHLLHRTMAAVAKAHNVDARASGRGAQPTTGEFGGSETGAVRETPQQSDLAALLEQAFRTAHGRGLVVVISDFLDVQLGRTEAGQQEGWQRALAPLAQRHEVVGVWMCDRREMELPPVGVVTFQDAETGEQVVVDTSQPTLREAYARQARARAAAMEKLFALHAAALWMLPVDEPFVPALVRFLEQRRKTLVGARRLLGAVG
ncbi:MAG: hypothetical protein PA3071 [uncultured Chloroflexi bacterium]|uniref:DUF58 domain-containing protein n=1 Tax=uncultured Chloroflexota bacterium TaxID=166587 RepID=A0A6J4K604_9CHLR|nr:MAG: hypothetical protein PA3071 [uncultured Chloroflexota bacterium]